MQEELMLSLVVAIIVMPGSDRIWIINKTYQANGKIPLSSLLIIGCKYLKHLNICYCQELIYFNSQNKV